MSEQQSGSPSAPLPLPDSPNIHWLRKEAKERLGEIRQTNPDAKLADAQFAVARQYGFSSWRILKAHVDSLTVDGQLVEAARAGDLGTVTEILDRHPEKLQVRTRPYEWTLLHHAGHTGHVEVVDLLLQRGLDANTLETGDSTTAMHWAAANGHLGVVRRLADAGGDVVGRGDDHALEVIGWATCWAECHAAVAEFLVSRGARHHIFSAIAMNDADEVRRIAGENPGALNARLTRNDDHRTPLHHAVLKSLPDMVSLLLELGADPLAVDGSGQPAATCATTPDADRAVMRAIRAMTMAELSSAARGHRPAQSSTMDLVAALALADWDGADQLVRESPALLVSSGGVLHLMAKRNDVAAVQWLLERGADPNGRWSHWDAEVTPLHLASAQGHTEVVRLLLEAGADPHIRDGKHEGDAMGWAQYGRVPPAPHWQDIVRMLETHGANA
jgi:ankyrin repeat protein